MAKKLAIFMTFFGLGMVVGPLVLAAGSAFISAWSRNSESVEVARLIDAYRDSLEPHRLFLTISSPDDGMECGYDPETIFPNGLRNAAQAFESGEYIPYSGYMALDRWRNEHRDDAYIAAIEQKMSQEVSEFEAGFLRRCIEGTLFADICKGKVESFGSKVDRFGRDLPKIGYASGHEDEVVCGFVDGTAARAGVPLAPKSASR